MIRKADATPTDDQAVFTLLDHQMDMMESETPYVAMVTGLGGGKTHVGSLWIVTRALEHPDSIHLATANSGPQCDDVVVPSIRSRLDEMGLEEGVDWHYTKKPRNFRIDAGNGKWAQVWVRSTDKDHIDKIARGPEFGSWWGDEVRDLPKYSAQVVFGRLRCGNVPYPMYRWTTTAAGQSSYVFERHIERGGGKYGVIDGIPTSANTFIRKDYVEDLRDSYDELLFEQEALGGWVDLRGKRAYHAFQRSTHVRPIEWQGDCSTWNPQIPIHMAWDNNVSPFKPWLTFQEHQDATFWFDEFACMSGVVYDACEAFGEKYGDRHESQVVVHADPAVKNRTGIGKTDLALIREGLEVYFPGRVTLEVRPRQVPEMDRRNAVNRRFKSMSGKVRAYVDPRCKRFIRDLERVLVGDDGRIDKKLDHELTHVAEAAGHAMEYLHKPSGFRSEPGYGNKQESRTRRLRERYNRTGMH